MRASAAVIVSTTHVNEFMSAFSRMRVPRQVTIPLAVMLRYVPAIREDWRFISDAMRMRGVNASLAGFLRRPGMTVECLYVPLMMSASNVADELSMASVAAASRTRRSARATRISSSARPTGCWWPPAWPWSWRRLRAACWAGEVRSRR
ncbi:MAG: energy-coupling factor transporter transmembrane component T [Eggerthellaceae bacterium]